MGLGPAGDGGEIGLAAEQSEEGQGQDGGEGVADASATAGIGQALQSGQQGQTRSRRHGSPSGCGGAKRCKVNRITRKRDFAIVLVIADRWLLFRPGPGIIRTMRLWRARR